jgi:hypothetical protein
MTHFLLKKQLTDRIDQHKLGHYLSIDDGKWIAVIIDFCNSKMLTTISLDEATRFLRGLNPKNDNKKSNF